MAPPTALLIASQWAFKFFHVNEVKLPDDESSVLSEVCHLCRSTYAISQNHSPAT
jgi:hypothetical protein